MIGPLASGPKPVKLLGKQRAAEDEMPAIQEVPQILEWAEYYCPWCYVAAVRLHRVAREFEGRVRFVIKPFPLELVRGEPAPRDILEQEWWLAAMQEPDAEFAPFRGLDWPTTTLPAFEAAWCAAQEGYAVGLDYDLRVRRGFFAEGRNIGRRDVLLDIAREAGLDVDRFRARWESGKARAAVLAEAQEGRERYGVRRTPTLMLGDGTPIKLPMSVPRFDHRRVVAVGPLTCVGTGCDDSTRALFERAAVGEERGAGDNRHTTAAAGRRI
jgi:predicted DsbA family dithiol-disulfide isomerase